MKEQWKVIKAETTWMVVRDNPNGLPGELDSYWHDLSKANCRCKLLNLYIDLEEVKCVTLIWNEARQQYLEIWGVSGQKAVPAWTLTPGRN